MNGKIGGLVTDADLAILNTQLLAYFDQLGFAQVPFNPLRDLVPLEYELLSSDRVGVFSFGENRGKGEKLRKLRFEARAVATLAMQLDELETFLVNLLDHLGFETEGRSNLVRGGDYIFAMRQHGEGSAVLDSKVEERIGTWAKVVMLTDFPLDAKPRPSWNVARGTWHASIIHTIVRGKGVIRSALRSCDKEQMKKDFEIEAPNMCAEFGINLLSLQGERDELFFLPFVPRFGGSIILENLAWAMKQEGLLPGGETEARGTELIPAV